MVVVMAWDSPSAQLMISPTLVPMLSWSYIDRVHNLHVRFQESIATNFTGFRHFHFHWEPHQWTSQWQLDSIDLEWYNIWEQCSSLVCSMPVFVSVHNDIAILVLVEHWFWLYAPFSFLLTQQFNNLFAFKGGTQKALVIYEHLQDIYASMGLTRNKRTHYYNLRMARMLSGTVGIKRNKNSATMVIWDLQSATVAGFAYLLLFRTASTSKEGSQTKLLVMFTRCFDPGIVWQVLGNLFSVDRAVQRQVLAHIQSLAAVYIQGASFREFHSGNCSFYCVIESYKGYRGTCMKIRRVPAS
ncbi:hypothetical protein ACHQM5_030445 [Ranunculus cassubicifolius]